MDTKYVLYIGVRYSLTLLHSERPKLHTILAFLSAIGLKGHNYMEKSSNQNKKVICASTFNT